jgi:uncharacterized protein
LRPQRLERTAGSRAFPEARAVLVVAILTVLGLLSTACGTETTASTATPTSTTTAGEVPQALVDAAAQLVDQLAARNFAAVEQSFDSTMQGALPEAALQQTWDALLSKAGAFKQITGTNPVVQQGYRIVLVATEFAQGNLTVRVAFDSSGKVAGLFFQNASAATPYASASYADPSKFTDREVTVGSGEWALPGTLTLPKGRTGPFPAVVLVHGSGPNDRDETIGPNKPFRDLAEGLATQGIAVLRYDKRTKVYAKKMAALKETVTVKQEVVDDAVAAVELLRTLPEVDPAKVFVLGHSLGGTLVPRIGRADAHVAGLISLAGATRPLEDLMLEQITYLASLENPPTPALHAKLKELEAQVAIVKDPALSPSTPASKLPSGTSAAYWLDLRGYKPAEVARSLNKPILVLQGARDYQVTTADFEGWKTALAGQPEAKTILYPDLNHLFMTGTGKSKPAEYGQLGHVSEQVIRDIAAWVAANK